MATILVPGDRKNRQQVRHFDTIVTIDRKGRVTSRRRYSGSVVLVKAGKERQLRLKPRSNKEWLNENVYQPLFYVMLGVSVAHYMSLMLASL